VKGNGILGALGGGGGRETSQSAAGYGAGGILGQSSVHLSHIQEDPNRMMLKEHNADTMHKQLNKEREDERIMGQLRAEFGRIDLNHDGSITMDEIVRFLKEQTRGAVDTGIAE
jgi:hypothetical protein